MNSTFTFLNARRAWLVRELAVHGQLHTDTIAALGAETEGSGSRVVFYQFALAGAPQEVAFASLVDHRGNPLPTAIAVPVVIPILRNAIPVALSAPPTPSGFRIAKTANTADLALVDLWIIEARD